MITASSLYGYNIHEVKPALWTALYVLIFKVHPWATKPVRMLCPEANEKMSVSKSWDWNAEKDNVWLIPGEESHYIAYRWKEAGFKDLLDFGCGLGRHSIFFANYGFCVSAFDLSSDGVRHLREWANREGLCIDTRVADMLQLPYSDSSFDCLFAYHVASHTDTRGMNVILREIKRVLKPGGEFYLTLCSKETWSFTEAGYPRLDENTIVKTDEGPEKDIPHFHVNLDDVLRLLSDFTLLDVRHTNDCFLEGRKQDSKHFFILGKK